MSRILVIYCSQFNFRVLKFDTNCIYSGNDHLLFNQKPMEIRNVVQFNNFLIGNGFRNLTPDTARLCTCVEQFNVINCGTCKNKEEATKKYNECSELYIQVVMSMFPTYNRTIMSKVPGNSMSFSKEGGHIRTITR